MAAGLFLSLLLLSVSSSASASVSPFCSSLFLGGAVLLRVDALIPVLMTDDDDDDATIEVAD